MCAPPSARTARERAAARQVCAPPSARAARERAAARQAPRQIKPHELHCRKGKHDSAMHTHGSGTGIWQL